MELVIIAFFLSVLFNFFIIIFGKKDLEYLRTRLSFGTYIQEINSGMVDMIGDRGATVVKLGVVIAFGIVLLFNFVGVVLLVGAIGIGTVVAKKAYQIPAVSNILNRIATYIKRLR